MIHTYSSITTWLTCRRKWLHKYKSMLTPAKEKETLSFGNQFHDILSHQLLGEQIDINTIEDPKLAAMTHFFKPNLDRYLSNTLGTWEVSATERQIQINWDGFELAGKIDLILNTGNQEKIIIDHKTTSKKNEACDPSSSYWLRLQRSLQSTIYKMLLIGSEVLPELPRVIWSVSVKPLIRQKQNETPEQFRQRMFEAIFENQDEHYIFQELVDLNYDESQKEVLEIIQEIETHQKPVIWPRTESACIGEYGPCEYLPLCSGVASEKDYVKNETQHQELSF